MCPAPCSCATEMKRIPASGKRSSASMYAEPTIPKTSVTPCATSVSTSASDGVIFSWPLTTLRIALTPWSRMVFMLFLCQVKRARSLQNGARIRIAITERIGHRTACHLAEGDVEPIAQVRIVSERASVTLVRQCQHERQSRVVECEGRRSRHAARHVGDTVMDDAVEDIRWLGMRRRTRSLEAASLIDGHVD